MDWCQVCGSQIKQTKRGVPRRTCSGRCRVKLHRHQDAVKNLVEMVACIQQGQPRPEPPPEYWGLVEELLFNSSKS